MGRHKASTSYGSCSHSRLVSSYSENWAIKRCKDMTNSTGGRIRTAIAMERHRQPQPHIQKLLDSLKIARCKKHNGAQLGIRQWTISNTPNIQCHYYRHNTTQSHMYILLFPSQHFSASVDHLQVLALTPRLLYCIEWLFPSYTVVLLHWHTLNLFFLK
jgi:hypothetical protein